METKLAELTDKVYKEGVAKGQAEAERILSEAQSKAEDIVKNATAEAQKIIEKAQNDAQEAKRNAESEIKLASSQALGALKIAIEQAITAKVVDAPIKDTFADKTYVAGLIKQAVDGFTAKGASDIKVILSEKDLKELNDKIAKSLGTEMKNGLEVVAGNVKSGFKIGPKDGSYFISFTEEDFKNFFKAYVRAQSAEILFGNK